MYQTFRVQNFRCFEDLELTNLGRINLIGGKNNTGKTTVLEAIILNSGNVHWNFLVRRSEKIEWKHVFYNQNTHSLIKMIGVTPHLKSRVGESIDEIDLAISLEPLSEVTFSDITKGFSVQQQEDFFSTLILEYGNRRYSMTPYSGEVIPSFFPVGYYWNSPYMPLSVAENFSLLRRKRRHEGIQTALKLLEPRLKDVEVYPVKGDAEVFLDIGLEELTPINLAGQGMSHLLGILSSIGSASGGVALLDEIENGLHHSILSEVWKAIYQAAVEFNVQIFATTHSDEMIQAANQVFSQMETNDFRYYRLDRKATGEIKAVAYQPEILGEAFEMNFEVRG